MQSLGVILPVEEVTLWCAGMVVIPKASGRIRICVDLKPLNKCVQREIYPLPRVDETLAQLSGATTFSKLDVNSGFWQIPLDVQSRPLTAFITPFGRFMFNKLPFGITCAPEIFQRRMSQIVSELPGVVYLMDDVLVFGSTEKEHDTRLHKVLRRLREQKSLLIKTSAYSSRQYHISRTCC